MSAFFMQNIVYVFFLYGLAFFAMGLVVYLESGRATEFRFARALRPLAFFGFVHGGHEWFEMFQIFAAHETGRSAGLVEETIRVLSLAGSFLFLLAFGVRLLPDAERRPTSSRWQVAAFAALWLLGVGFIAWRLRPGPGDLLVAADVLARYGLGIPGALLASWALLRERHDFHARGMSVYGKDLLWAALALFIYGVIGQFFVRPSLVFPSQVVNTALFLRTFGIPVQLLRSLAATAVAITLGGALRAFEMESRERLARANKARIEAQTAALDAQERRANEVEALNVRLQTTARELAAMVELARILSSTMELRNLLRYALYQVVNSFELSCCGHVFLKRRDGQLEAAGEYRRPDAPTPTTPAALEQAVRRAIGSGQIVGVELGGRTSLLDPDNASELSDDLATDGMFRTLAAPLSAKQELFGALVMSSLREDEPFGLKDAALLMAFAQQVATFVENARLYQVVQERETQLGQLVRQLVNAQEGERQRIARELHDETGQKLSALAMGLAAVETQLAAGDRSRPVILVQNLRQVADHALTELRNVMANLRPSQLDDLGLAPALHWYSQQHAVRHPQTNITFTAERLAQRLPAEYETVLFRAAQETLTNVARHAQATQVTVVLSQQGDAVRLEVVDNGVGFDIQSPAAPEHQGWGLIGMRERVALVGGVCTIESQPGKGTRVVIELPQRPKDT